MQGNEPLRSRGERIHGELEQLVASMVGVPQHAARDHNDCTATGWRDDGEVVGIQHAAKKAVAAVHPHARRITLRDAPSAASRNRIRRRGTPVDKRCLGNPRYASSASRSNARLSAMNSIPLPTQRAVS